MEKRTIQVQISPKFKPFFEHSKTDSFTIEKFLEKIGLDKDTISELQYIRSVENDLKNKHYTISNSLGRNIQ